MLYKTTVSHRVNLFEDKHFDRNGGEPENGRLSMEKTPRRGLCLPSMLF